MSEERQVKRWITVNGKHVPIYEDTDDWMDSAMKARYSRYINDRSFDKHLDSDEMTWVEALRAEQLEKQQSQKERQIEQNKQQADILNNRADNLKPWSKSEQRRTEETSKMIDKYLRINEDNGYEIYEQDSEEVYNLELPMSEYGLRDGLPVWIYKEWFKYAQSRDENYNRVTKGKKVTGTTSYGVSIDGDILDENVLGYKTYADAKHALDLYLDALKKAEQKRRGAR